MNYVHTSHHFVHVPRRVIVLLLALASFIMNGAHAAVWYVHPDSALHTIQAGLDSCTAGDTVLVGPGVYYENLMWPYLQGIILISEHGPDTTVIDGNEDGSVIDLSLIPDDSLTIIDGFTIQNGYAWSGGGIYSVGGKPLISNNIIRNNTCEWPSGEHGAPGDGPPPQGGGIYTEWSSAVIMDNVITDNSAQNGGGIACFCDAANISTTIINNTILYNTAHNGGGIYMDCPFTMCMIKDNTISFNTAYNGGGIACYYVFQPLLTIRKNVITHNTADSVGGGVWCYVSSIPFIDSCTIAHNIGDGIYAGHFSAPVISFNNILDNDGFGVHNDDSSVIVMAENNWWGDASGPYHPTNPAGLGDTVSDHVDFTPWLVIALGVEEQQVSIPAEIMLQVFPNPFRTMTRISIGAGQRAESIELSIYDITGRQVKSYFLSTAYSLMPTIFLWHGRDDQSRLLPAGVYFVELKTGTFSTTEKVLIVR